MENLDPVVLGLTAVGALVVAKFVLGIVLSVLNRVTFKAKPAKSYGNWVVITGATDGIGKALSFSYAKRGMNVFLISRTQSKLDAVAKEVADKHNVETKTLAIDFSKFDEAAQKRVRAELEKLDSLGILVNNVGMSYPFPMYFHELDDQDVKGLLELNMYSLTIMSRIAIPLMIPNKKGAVLNMGSAAGLHPSPCLAIYSATKAYVETLSHALNTEYGKFGIVVQGQVPLYFVSKLSKMRKASPMVPSAEHIAEEAIECFGNGPVASPHFLHDVAMSSMDLLPEWILQKFFLSYHLSIRKAGMKKRERLAAEAKKQ